MFRFVRIASLMAAVAWLIAGAAAAIAAEGAAGPAKAKAAVVRPASPETSPALTLTEERVAELAKATGLTSDAVRVSLDYIVKYKPRLARDLENSLKVDPQQVKNQISNLSYYARELAQLKKTDPVRGSRREQTLELDAQAERLTDRYKEVSEAERAQVEIELTNVLAKAFDLRLEEERYQLEQLKKQVEQMEARINERLKNKDRIVDRYMTTLLGLNESLTW